MGQDRDHRRLITLAEPQTASQDQQRTDTRPWTPTSSSTSHRDRTGWRLTAGTLDGATATLVTIEGQVDVAVADRLCNELLCCLERGPRRLFVDLSRVTFLDAAAINALLFISRSGAHRRIPMVLVAVPRRIRRVLTALNLDHVLAHAFTISEALARIDDPVCPSTTTSTNI